MNKFRSKKTLVTGAALAGGVLLIYHGLSIEKTLSSEQMLAQLRTTLKQELFNEVRQEVYNEIRQDISLIVQDEVKNEMALYIAQSSAEHVDQQAANTADQKTPDQLSYRRELIKDAVRKIVREAFHADGSNSVASSRELDAIIAGHGVKPDLGIVGGLTKNPDQSLMLLAKNVSAENVKYRAEPASQDDELIVGGEERAESIERTLQQKGSILLPKGTLIFEPSTTWANVSSNRINIQGFSILPILVIGDISTETVRRDIFIQNFSLKYGLLNNFQAELKVPFRGQYERVTVNDTSENTRSTFGIGDVEVGVSRQIGWEKGLMPDLIGALNFKSDTGKSPYNRTIGLGTGHYALRGALIAAKSSDPAVVFGSLNYTANFSREIDNFGDVNPGDTIGYSVGIAIALSYQTAMNFSFDHSLTGRLKRDGNNVTGSFVNSANIKTGVNWAINEKSSVDFSVAIGVTNDAPDVTVELRFPYVF